MGAVFFLVVAPLLLAVFFVFIIVLVASSAAAAIGIGGVVVSTQVANKSIRTASLVLSLATLLLAASIIAPTVLCVATDTSLLNVGRYIGLPLSVLALAGGVVGVVMSARLQTPTRKMMIPKVVFIVLSSIINAIALTLIALFVMTVLSLG
ncbi:MAG: hypothetical protein LBO07_03475 [Coriobacteriales bacterium]|nr:hypothetical protein [Coriobacteriales bacterium]